MKQLVQIIQITQELSGRWTIPILLTLQETRGRFTPLQNRLDIAPSRLSDNLKKLESKGIVKHLSPYERRHPLLPEYQLTEKGLFLKEAAQAVRFAEAELDRGNLSEKSWNWPVILALHNQCHRFQAIRKMLPEATPRIVSIRIDELLQIELVRKTISTQSRPTYLYSLQSEAEPLIGKVETDLYSLL